MNEANFVTEITVQDPDFGGDVAITIFKHAESGGMFGIDASYIEQCFEDVSDEDDDSEAEEISVQIPDPFNTGDMVVLKGVG